MNLALEFVSRLDDNFSSDQMKLILDKLELFLADYDIKRKETSLAIIDSMPAIYKEYMVSKKLEGRSNGTLSLYKLYLEDMIKSINKDIKYITTGDLKLYLYRIKEVRNLSDRTLDSRRLALNSFFGWCNKSGYIQSNPMVAINPIKYEEKPREPLTNIEMELLRNSCNTIREKAIVEFLYSTGCRCSELTNLSRYDIDLTAREVKLFGKGRKHRISYLSARAAVAVAMYLNERKDDSEFAFVSERKPFNKLTNEGVEKIIRKIAERAGIENVFPHRIRHTFATDALEHGMDIVEVQNILGHEKTETTLIYAKVKKSTIKSNHMKYIN